MPKLRFKATVHIPYYTGIDPFTGERQDAGPGQVLVVSAARAAYLLENFPQNWEEVKEQKPKHEPVAAPAQEAGGETKEVSSPPADTAEEGPPVDKAKPGGARTK